MPTEKQLILKDLKAIVKHAKEKGDTELADKLQLKCDKLEAKVKSEGAETENNSDTGLELDETSVKFKNEGNEVTVFSRWKKTDPNSLLPRSGPLSHYNDLIKERVTYKSMHQAVRQLANINTLKTKRSCGYELTEEQVERVLCEEDFTEEIKEMIFKKYGGFQYVWMCPGHAPKKIKNRFNNAYEITKYYPYTRNNDALIKRSRRSKLNKHLREIQSLKNESHGVGLTPGQLDKINREEELQEELADQHSGLFFI